MGWLDRSPHGLPLRRSKELFRMDRLNILGGAGFSCNENSFLLASKALNGFSYTSQDFLSSSDFSLNT